MTIQFNTDHNIDAKEGLVTTFTELIEERLSKVSDHITRIEGHLKDEDSGAKDGKNDIRCVLEARLEGRKPIAVTNHADNHYQAVDGAIDKLKSSIDSILGRIHSH